MVAQVTALEGSGDGATTPRMLTFALPPIESAFTMPFQLFTFIRTLGLSLAAICAASHAVANSPACASPAPPEAIQQTVVVPLPSDADPTSRPRNSTTIALSVLLPARCPGEVFPVVLHSHGYGGTRVSTLAANGELPTSLPLFPAVTQLAQTLPFHGYVVISFDQRGHGESKPANGGGHARIIDPALETQDARAIVDWAYDNAERFGIQRQTGTGIAKDIKVGTLGVSYGGGFQLPLAALEPRIDTIVPVGTWHDLMYSLLPGDAVKLGFDGLLCLLGVNVGGVQNTPVVASLCNQVNVNNPTAFNIRSRANLVSALNRPTTQPRKVSDNELADFFTRHGMGYFQAQERAGRPWGFKEAQARLRKVPALFIQGNRDNLFNLTEAYWNQRYFEAAGGDVRLLSTEGGHMNPLAYQTEGNSNCGNLAGIPAVLAWFDQHLKGVPSDTARAIPKVCLSVADTVGAPMAAAAGVALNEVPVGSLSGPGAMGARLSSLNARVPALATQPVFVKVATVRGAGQVMAGIPTVASLEVAPTPGALQATNAFVGVGIVRGGKTILVDDQVTAFGVGSHTSNRNSQKLGPVLLPGVGERLQDGDEVGLLFYPQHVQYASVVSAVGLSGATGLFNVVAGSTGADGAAIPPIASSLEPALGLFYNNPYTVKATGIELPIFKPGLYPGSRLLR